MYKRGIQYKKEQEKNDRKEEAGKKKYCRKREGKTLCCYVIKRWEGAKFGLKIKDREKEMKTLPDNTPLICTAYLIS